MTGAVFRGQRNVEKPGAASEIEEEPGEWNAMVAKEKEVSTHGRPSNSKNRLLINDVTGGLDKSISVEW